MAYFEYAWTDRWDWIRMIKQHLHRCPLRISPFNHRYQDDYIQLMILNPLLTSSSPQIINVSHSDFLIWKYGNSVKAASDELKKYLSVNCEIDPLLDIHTWWIHHQMQYPILFRIAMDLISIPYMLAEVERVFSRCFPSRAKCMIRYG